MMDPQQLPYAKQACSGKDAQMITVAELEIETHDWNTLTTLTGSARHIPFALRELLAASTSEALEVAYWKIENSVVAQGAVYTSAEAVTAVLVASFLDPRSQGVKISALELLYQILAGYPANANDTDLIERCKCQAKKGTWLFTNECLNGVAVAAADVLELLGESHYLVLQRSRQDKL
jgi:hypothetical protein